MLWNRDWDLETTDVTQSFISLNWVGPSDVQHRTRDGGLSHLESTVLSVG